MLDFSYYIPTRVAFGKSAMEQLPVFLKNGGWKKILIHYGGKSAVESGLLHKVIQCVEQAQACFVRLGGVQPNPKVSLVREGIRICKEREIDLILAVGGGSVIDSAKAIALGAKMENDIWDVLARKPCPLLPFRAAGMGYQRRRLDSRRARIEGNRSDAGVFREPGHAA